MDDNIKNKIELELAELGYSKLDVYNCIIDVNIRLEWHINSKCLMYSRKNKKWFNGKIIDIFIEHETNEEWLKIEYNIKTKKKIQRFSNNIKPGHFNDDDRNYNQKILKYVSNKLRQTSTNKLIKYNNNNNNFEPKSQQNIEITKQNNDKKEETFEIKQDAEVDSINNLKWDTENYQKHNDNKVEFSDDNKVKVNGIDPWPTIISIKNEKYQNRFGNEETNEKIVYGFVRKQIAMVMIPKELSQIIQSYILIRTQGIHLLGTECETHWKCKLIKVPSKSDIQKTEYGREEYKLSFGLIHKTSDRSYLCFDSFELLNGEILGIQHVNYERDEKSLCENNKVEYYRLNERIARGTTGRGKNMNSDGTWGEYGVNWFHNIHEGDIFELIVKYKEKKLILLVNDKERASIMVEADYPMEQCYVGFKFEIYKTDKPTIIQLL